MMWLSSNRFHTCNTTFLTSELLFRIFLILGSSKAIGKDPEDSDVDEVVIISECDTQSDEEDNSNQPTTSMEHTERVSNVDILDNSTAAPYHQSTSLETELLPLVTDPDSAVPESELIVRDCAAMEEEVQQRTDQKAEQHTQVATFALI